MPTRARRNWKPDARGYYSRQLGWIYSKTGKLQQQKFLLGKDRVEAERRERKLRELWDCHCRRREESRSIWPDDLLAVAKRVARGQADVPVARGPTEKQLQYASRIQGLQRKYPVIAFIPEDQHAYEIGLAVLEQFDVIAAEAPLDLAIKAPSVNELEAMKQAAEILKAAGVAEFPPSATSLESPQKSLFGVFNPGEEFPSNQDATKEKAPIEPSARTDRDENHGLATVSLHKAMKAYEVFLGKEYFNPDTEQISPWGKTQIRQVMNLRKHHRETLLSKLDADAVNEMIAYWRRRPCKLGTQNPMTAKSCSNYLGALIRFLKWLDRSSKFRWNKPVAFSDTDTKVRRLSSDTARRSIQQVDTFSLDELGLLMKYANNRDRLLVLLALNCGFGRAEISSLLVGELYIRHGHTQREQEILNYRTSNKDSFIKRIRRKSGVYGEHILFRRTVDAIQLAIEDRKKLPGFSPEAVLLLNSSGNPLDKQTPTGNANQYIPNRFDRLIKRIQEDGHPIRKLSFGKLRKTATDLVKRFSDGEVAGVFDCHGSPVKSDTLSDLYSNRPFGKVFKAIREVEDYLKPVLAEVDSVSDASNQVTHSRLDRVGFVECDSP